VLTQEWGTKGVQKGYKRGTTRVKLQTLARWSTEFHWQERVKEYDREQAERRLQAQEEQRQQEAACLRQRSEELQQAVHQYLLSLLEQRKLGGQAAAQIWKATAEIKRDFAGVAHEPPEQLLQQLAEGEYILIKTHWGTPQLPRAQEQAQGSEEATRPPEG
jgi:membrane protein involved in colicin uptake